MKCSYCNDDMPADAKECPRCLRLGQAQTDVYELPATSMDVPAAWRGAAVYTLEQAARCPLCGETIQTVSVIRLKRSQVAFTSTLPRGGRIIACSSCTGILSADLSTL